MDKEEYLNKNFPYQNRSFEAHQIVGEMDCKSWHLRKDGKEHNFWIVITWTAPGVLLLSGDAYSMILTHYGAMSTWQKAAYWVRGASYDYFMEKSNKEKQYSAKATAAWIIECLQDHRDDEYYNVLGVKKQYEEYYLEDLGQIDEPGFWESWQNDIESKIEEVGDAYRLIENVFKWSDPYEYICMEYDDYCKIQYCAIQSWAREVIKELESDSGNTKRGVPVHKDKVDPGSIEGKEATPTGHNTDTGV
jgi:hypothetical protein